MDLPPDFRSEGAEPGIIPSDDLRVPLRGSGGLFTSMDLPAGFPISCYRGYVSLDECHQHLLENPPRPDWTQSNEEWEKLVESYCVNDKESYHIRLTKKNEVVEAGLYLDAVGYGNIASLVNDCVVYPMGPPKKEGGTESDDIDLKPGDYPEDYYEFYSPKVEEGPNCKILTVLIRNWPYNFLVTTRDIKKGKELLLMYGYSYWRLVKEISMRAEKAAASMPPLRFFGPAVRF